MNYQEAVKQVVTLKKQGLTYPKIEQVLKEAGYTSARTKKPVGALAVRHMFNAAQDRERRELLDKRAASDSPSNVGSTESQFLGAIQKLLQVKDMSTDIKVRLIKSLISETERELSAHAK